MTQALAADPRQQAVRLFMRVWGTGEATAERWYKDGCRSLADVGARGDLTRQQARRSTQVTCSIMLIL